MIFGCLWASILEGFGILAAAWVQKSSLSARTEYFSFVIVVDWIFEHWDFISNDMCEELWGELFESLCEIIGENLWNIQAILSACL